MIGYLKGKVLAKNPDSASAVLLTHRVGYELSLPLPVFDQLAVGETATLWVYTHVREDILALYGFTTESEKNFFRMLLSVSGLGPRSSLALLSEHGSEKLASYLRSGDAVSIATAPGIGKKLAQKMLLELQPKVEKLGWLALASRPLDGLRSSAEVAAQPLREDVASALLNLGFAPQVVKPTVERIFDKGDAEKAGFEACLKSALKELNTRPPTATEGAARG